MVQNSGSRLLSTRNVLGAVLVAGIAAGVYLGGVWKGFGGGSMQGIGIGDPSPTPTQKSSDSKVGAKGDTKSVVVTDSDPDREKTSTVSGPAPQVVKVVIADRSYFLRSADGDQAAELKQVVSVAKTAIGDEDGIRVRVYRKLSSRTAAEIALRDALVAAGITDEQTAWVATPVDD